MQTGFTSSQLTDPQIATADAILRKCVHCGFCTATCPTYVLLGDELDSPRGRIYLIKDMLENDRAADVRTVRHIDRCLSCLSCMTTCPSGVHYMHLIDQARAHIHETHKRSLPDRALRRLLSVVLPRPNLFRLSLLGAKLARSLRRLLPGRLKGLIAMAPKQIPSPSWVDKPQLHKADGRRRMRVALLTGCAQRALAPNINETTIRLLNRLGVEVVIAKGAGCCGALTHHMGMAASAHDFARKNINAWHDEMRKTGADGGLDHIVVNTSGCGTTIKDYGFMFRNDPQMAQKAEAVSSIALDITELLTKLDYRATQVVPPLKIAYHSACSLQHGQKVTSEPVKLLEKAGFDVTPVPESHLCCGSAGTYNLLQPELAGTLAARKAANIESTGADAVAAGNLGCIIQIAGATDIPVMHSVELLDWASGGPCPQALEKFALPDGPQTHSPPGPTEFIISPGA